MVESCGMSAVWRVLTRIVAAASGAMALAMPGTVALADETAPPAGTATITMPSEPAAGGVASATLVVGLPVGDARPAAVGVVSAGTTPGEAAAGASTLAPAAAGRWQESGVVGVAIAGRLVTVVLVRGPEVADPCRAAGGACTSPPTPSRSLAAPRSSSAAGPWSTSGAGAFARPPAQAAPGDAAGLVTPVGGLGACAVLAGTGVGTGTDCGPVTTPGADDTEEGQGSTRPAAVARDGTGCPAGCLARLELGEPLGAAGVDYGEAVRGDDGTTAPAPVPNRPTPVPASSRSGPLLASTGSPLVAGLAGLLMVVLGVLLTWRRVPR
ncbi:MAG TPA: hypothetical protein VFD49_21620 [Candidatus Dormibacteraeota bacterium]|nr:hypothetical protein [Candidatus Dormibacteraeota bacterium]